MALTEAVASLIKEHLQDHRTEFLAELRHTSSKLKLIELDDLTETRIGLAGESLKLSDESLAQLRAALATRGVVVELFLDGEPQAVYAHGWLLIVAADQLGSLSEKRFIADKKHLAKRCQVLITRSAFVPEEQHARVLDYARRLFSPPLDPEAVGFLEQLQPDERAQLVLEQLQSGSAETRQAERELAVGVLLKQLESLKPPAPAADIEQPSEEELRATLDYLEHAVEGAQLRLAAALSQLKRQLADELPKRLTSTTLEEAALITAAGEVERDLYELITRHAAELTAALGGEVPTGREQRALQLSLVPRYQRLQMRPQTRIAFKAAAGVGGFLFLRRFVVTPRAVLISLLVSLLPIDRLLDPMMDHSAEDDAYAAELNTWLDRAVELASREGRATLARLSAVRLSTARAALNSAEAAAPGRAARSAQHDAIQHVIELLHNLSSPTGG